MYFYSAIKFLANIVFRLIFRIEVHGKENVIKEGRLILCSNHIHNFDPIILAMVFPRQVCWMAKKEIFKSKIFASFLDKLGAFPVDREESDLSAIKNALRVLKNENVLGIFPEGTRVKEVNLDNAKPGIALISIKSKAPIIPVYIEGNYKLFSKIKICFGRVIDFSSSYDKKLNTEDYRLLSQDILKTIYSIKYKEEEI